MFLPVLRPLTFCALMVGVLGAHAQSTSCLVLGSKDARVSSSEGEKSPVFVAKACGSLRLISGQAQASWVARDGKPRVVPITTQGVAGVPAAGAEERSVNYVWAELTTKRERQQPAYMRSFGEDRAATVYVPSDGLLLVPSVDSTALVRVTREGEVSREFEVPIGSQVRLSRQDLKAGQIHTVQIQRGDMVEAWKWRIASESEAARIDESLAEIAASDVLPDQRGLMGAMLYEQLKLRVNMDLSIQALRAAAAR